MEQPLSQAKYRLPAWIQRVVLVVSVALIAMNILLPADVWGPIAVIAIAAVSSLMLLYNKGKTGRWLPNDRR